MYMLKTDSWYLERTVFLMGGVMTLLSVALTVLHSTYWPILTTLVGLNLLVFALTGFCLMAIVLNKLGKKPMLCKAGCSAGNKSE